MYFKVLKNYFLDYIVQIIVAVIIYNVFGLIALILYVFFTLLLKIDANTNYLRALIRVFHSGNETKLLAMMRELKIPDSKLNNLDKEIESKLTQEQYDSLKDDLKTIMK